VEQPPLSCLTIAHLHHVYRIRSINVSAVNSATCHVLSLSFSLTLPTPLPSYASIANHDGVAQSRRDDFESVAYMLIYFLKGKLPWQGLKANDKRTKYGLILETKLKTPIATLCDGLPKEFAEFLVSFAFRFLFFSSYSFLFFCSWIFGYFLWYRFFFCLFCFICSILLKRSCLTFSTINSSAPQTLSHFSSLLTSFLVFVTAAILP
jgi:hypothetical protein